MPAANAAIPNGYDLDQNYPNPFNPSTIITYAVPATGEVHLAVYDALGQQVVVLVDGIRQAGAYQVRVDASDLSSGIYFYRLEAGATTLTRKMTLLK